MKKTMKEQKLSEVTLRALRELQREHGELFIGPHGKGLKEAIPLEDFIDINIKRG